MVVTPVTTVARGISAAIADSSSSETNTIANSRRSPAATGSTPATESHQPAVFESPDPGSYGRVTDLQPSRNFSIR